VASGDKVIMNDELERTGKEVVVAWFKALFQHLSGRTEENHEKPQSC
jgi:hypothetical protein